MTYHCNQMRKMPLSKCDASMAFCFYLRNESDFRLFCKMHKRGQEEYGGDWPFSILDWHWFNKYNKEHKKK